MYVFLRLLLWALFATVVLAKKAKKDKAGTGKYPSKSLMNRACRATWICNENKCLGESDEQWTSCNGNKNCRSDLENWVLLGANKQWGTAATQYKAVYNMVKKANCEKMLKNYPWVKKRIEETVKDVRQYGYKVETKGLGVCDYTSRVCIASPKGIKKGMPQQTILVSLNPNAKKYPTGSEKTRTYFRAYSIEGETDGYVSAKQH